MTSESELEGTHPEGRPDVRQFFAWAQRVKLESRLAVLLLGAALLSGSTTFAAMMGWIPGIADPRSILLLLTLDLILLLLFGALIARRLVLLYVQRRREAAGARLHSRLVGIFALVAVTPTLIIAVFSTLLFDFGLQGWFSDRVRTAVKESLAVAESYLQEHRQTIVADALAMAQDLNRLGPTLALNPQRFAQIVSGQAALRSLTEALVFDRSGRVLAKAGFSLLLDFDPELQPWALTQADRGDVVILTPDTDDRVRALIALDAMPDTYLYVGRLVDPRVLAHTERSSDAVRLYEQLEGQRSGLIITFALIFLVIALLLVLASSWVGLIFADRITRPVGNLIRATQRIGGGDLSARVEAGADDDEVGTLARAFNRMTADLERQQQELIEANRHIEERRRFIEAVLSGVSAGVIGVDAEGRVTLANRSACELLSISAEQLRGRKVARLSRDMRQLVEMARNRPGRVQERQVSFTRRDRSHRTLLVRIMAETDGPRVSGFVVTFDDVTELMAAQRKAAWADVARRIAHEIKNPLTPIQLSAERLKRKYLRQIGEDRETFEACTDTIVRQVGDIGRMVDEFSSFARMPSPIMAPHDLRHIAEEALTLQSARNDLEFVKDLPAAPVLSSVDAGQIRQALTNLLQNAVDSIEGRAREQQEAGEKPEKGQVTLRLTVRGELAVIEVSDNGRGLPRKERDRLTEPYVTTREGGTGLGLAIVKKIMEDHGGDLRLEDRPEGGALARLLLKVGEDDKRPSAAAESSTGVAAHGA